MVTLIGAGVLLGWIAPAVAAGLTACALLPYLLLVIGGSELLGGHRGANHLLGVLARTLEQRPRATSVRRAPSSDDPARHLLGLIALDVALIVAGSAGMVQAALTLASPC